MMFLLVDSIIVECRVNGDQDEKDLFVCMLNVEDLEIGEKFDDENICFQIIMFLIVGYEIMSGLFFFVIYFLLKYFDKLKKVYEEVDWVLMDVVLIYK